ncbi:hypothetical protein ACM66B_002942 [Microbotryomycetes sp. NB124-2]
MTSSSITALEQAQSRISELERRLDLIEQALRTQHGSSIESLLMNQPATNAASQQPEQHPVAVSSVPAEQSDAAVEVTNQDSAQNETTEVDIGPLVLQALQLRKRLQHGEIDQVEAVDGLQRIVDSRADLLTAAQVAQLRQWSGL